MTSIRALTADDHPMILEGLRSVLPRLGIEVAGQASSADEVLTMYKQVKPDVVVLDVRFGDGPTGLDIARDLLRSDPRARIVFYSQFDQQQVVRDAYKLGGAAFVTKSEPETVLCDAIREAALGKVYFVPTIAERLALLGVMGDKSPRSCLNDREFEVFTRLARGCTNNEIAEQLLLSSKTIGVVAQTVREKLGVERAADLTRLAVRYGVLEP